LGNLRNKKTVLILSTVISYIVDNIIYVNNYFKHG